MINFDDVSRENIKEHNPKLPKIPDNPCIILIIGGSGSKKTISLLDLIRHQPDIAKNNLYSKGLHKINVNCYLQMQRYRLKVFK